MGNCLYTRSGHRMVQKLCTDRDNYSIRLYKDPDLFSGIKDVLSVSSFAFDNCELKKEKVQLKNR